MHCFDIKLKKQMQLYKPHDFLHKLTHSDTQCQALLIQYFTQIKGNRFMWGQASTVSCLMCAI